jgi:hypothetical protein
LAGEGWDRGEEMSAALSPAKSLWTPCDSEGLDNTGL